MIFQKKVKKAIQIGFGFNHAPVLVASMGRSGSTLLHNAIIASWATQRFPFCPNFGRKIIRDTAWELDQAELTGGVVYKTHDLAQYLVRNTPVKVLFVYSRASDAVISVYSSYERYGAVWFEAHLKHLRGTGTIADLATNDILRLEEQIDSWMHADGLDILGLRYETLWNNVMTLSEFLGLNVELPRKRLRSEPEISQGLIQTIRDSYAMLDQKIAELPDIFRHIT